GAQQALAAAQDLKLESVLGTTRGQTFTWYAEGLECCKAVVHVQTRFNEGFGTGWLVAGDAFGRSGEVLMVTNKHVISPPVNGQPYQASPDHVALLPEEAVLYHQLSNTSTKITSADVLWSSDDLTLDATIVGVRTPPRGATFLALSPTPVQMRDP